MSIDFKDERFNSQLVSGWITDLASSDSRLHKEAVLEKALMASRLGSAEAQAFLFNCYQAYQPFYIFGVKKVKDTTGLTNKQNPWTKFWALLESLRTRTLTGNNAKTAIEKLSQDFDSDEWNLVCKPVIIKDLRCGISEKTLNKILGKTEWRIPTFSCQLAQDSQDHPAKLKGIKRLEAKLDGVRVLALVTSTSVTLYSRNGKVFENFPQIETAIDLNRKAFLRGSMHKGPFVLDGEIVGESFQKLMRQAHRKSDAKTEGMVYHIFDIMPLDDFERGYCNAQQYKRLNWLEPGREILDKTDCLRLMDGFEVDLDTSEGHDIMHRWAEDAVAHGFEGIMIKSMDAPYECKRNDFWMKWKPTITVDLDIVGFEEGTGRNQHRLGAIICEGEDNGRRIHVNVGSGLSDADRNEYWALRHQLVGRVVEIQADAVTQNQDGSYSLRFPRFLRFRGFDISEKL